MNEMLQARSNVLALVRVLARHPMRPIEPSLPDAIDESRASDW